MISDEENIIKDEIPYNQRDLAYKIYVALQHDKNIGISFTDAIGTTSESCSDYIARNLDDYLIACGDV